MCCNGVFALERLAFTHMEIPWLYRVWRSEDTRSSGPRGNRTCCWITGLWGSFLPSWRQVPTVPSVFVTPGSAEPGASGEHIALSCEWGALTKTKDSPEGTCSAVNTTSRGKKMNKSSLIIDQWMTGDSKRWWDVMCCSPEAKPQTEWIHFEA